MVMVSVISVGNNEELHLIDCATVVASDTSV